MLFRVLLVLCALSPLQLRAESARPNALSGATMGTTYSVKWLEEAKGPNAIAIHQAITNTLARVEGRMSTYREDSEVSRFNAQRETNWFAVSAETAGLVEDAQRISAMTQGAFDITVYPLVELWGFGPKRGLQKEPSAGEISAAMGSVGFGKLEVRANPPALRKRVPSVAIDLSGIAKGYGVDALAAKLEEMGVRNYLVGIGGELKARGKSSEGRPWRVGIDRPDEGSSAIDHVVELRDCAISTSGDYRNFHQIGARRYAHIINPQSGRPVSNGIASVSVIHKSSAWADALATALMVQGATNGMRTAEGKSLEVMMVERDGEQWRTQWTPRFPAMRVQK